MPSCDGNQFDSYIPHQVVRANRRDFLRHRIARHFRSLPRQGPGLSGRPCDSQGDSWRVVPKVSGGKFPFPRLLFARCPPPRPISNCPWGIEPRDLTRFGMDGSARRAKTNEQGRIVPYRLRRRLESERAPLIRPGHWQVDETLETKVARQASLWAEECESRTGVEPSHKSAARRLSCVIAFADDHRGFPTPSRLFWRHDERDGAASRALQGGRPDAARLRRPPEARPPRTRPSGRRAGTGETPGVLITDVPPNTTRLARNRRQPLLGAADVKCRAKATDSVDN